MVFYRELSQTEAVFAEKIEKACLDTAWTKEQISNLPENAIYLGAFEDNTLCGIISAYFVLDEVQIMNLAVDEAFRNKGYAKGLLNSLITASKEKNCSFITLEVAENNTSAISLYKKCGFNAVGKRKNFYKTLSAILMEKNL